MVKRVNGLSRELIIHPGETLSEVLEDKGMTQRDLANRTGVTEKHVSTIVNGLKPISVAYAKKLEYALRIDASFWINLQSNYDKELLEYEEINCISSEEQTIMKKIKPMLEHFLELKPDLVQEVSVIETRKLLGVSNLEYIPRTADAVAFRKSKKDLVDVYIMFVWIKLCELCAAQMQTKNSLDKQRLIASLPKIKALMFCDIKDSIGALQQIFSECGIAFVLTKSFRGAPVHGFIKKTDTGNMVLVMTVRGVFADIFWFSLFHEIAHITSGDVKHELIDFVDSDKEVERKADQLAGEMLLDDLEYMDFAKARDFSLAAIKNFAAKQGVPPYVVIGRLQKEELLKYGVYNSEKVRYAM